MEIKTLSDDPVSWPVIAFGGDGSLTCVETISTLRRPSALALRNGYFNGLTLIDAEGVVHRLDGVIPDKHGAILCTIRRILNLRVPVELLLVDSDKLTLEEAKLRIALKVCADSSFWDSGHALADLEKKIAAAPSFTALCTILR